MKADQKNIPEDEEKPPLETPSTLVAGVEQKDVLDDRKRQGFAGQQSEYFAVPLSL